MIFVTVGTHYQGFERLIRKMDKIAGRIDDEVIMQIGYTTYEPKNAKWFRFLEREEDILELYKKADVIVAHAGAGTLLTALSFGKPIVVVPRLKKFGEHVDDQQLELAEALENMNKAIAVYDIEKLEDAIKKAKLLLKYRPIQRNKKLILFLKSTLRRLEK
ncbi:PssE/Cps14G family polysaccharide biosynthesis glycosyltransferase [Thermococcus sp. Bubb.Bath]|uniref:PssE/Cps14G family polysaccharide biosynthesis glycosyltransferase n=2 Tax=unclassified Thermococcus TaxID=2627626 RepID=UPI00143C664A|nr:PssE/Cps14G family polysaccharide biosynthesis glycosyltransferase [Thermococcus sp. Bubb.Bath]NJF25150.1 beta-1,4-galactosyltransferase [Thermococcus sp. Bubb.Bath]